MTVDWKEGVVDVVAGDIAVGMTRVGDAAHDAEAAGYEETGVSAFRDAATLAARAMDYAGATRWINEGLRYADSIEQSHCAHVMSATGAMVSWADARWVDANAQARQAVADHGCRRAAEDGTMGARLRRPWDEVRSTRRPRSSARRSRSANRAKRSIWSCRRSGDLPRSRSSEANRTARWRCVARRSSGREAVGERILLAPFVVTGVRAAQAAGRPAAAATWYRRYRGRT